MRPRRVVVEAPAKVNLSLAVGEKRADGYRAIDTVLLAISLCDRVEVCEGAGREGGVRLELSGPSARGVPADAENLAVRAALEVQALAHSRGIGAPPLLLRLEKHIPSGAGLGGGSSNAAAAAFGAALVLGLDPEESGLAERLAALGSDCPFFLAARTSGLARCTGRGERVEALSAPEIPWFLGLVTPDLLCSTAEVYRALPDAQAGDQRPSSAVQSKPFAVERFALASLEQAQAMMSNGLEPAALRAYPALDGWRALLEEERAGAFRLAGSGSSFFALFADEPSARAAIERVRVRAEERRYGLRGRWVLRARGGGVRCADSSSHFGQGPAA